MQKLTPPAPAGVAENSSSPIEEFCVTALWCTLTFRLWQYGSCRFVGSRWSGRSPEASVRGAAR